MRRYLLGILLLSLLIAACAKEGSATSAIQDYLKAKVSSDAGKLTALSCKAWEAGAKKDASSFESVKAELRDLACSEAGKDGDFTLVACTGQIVVEYDGETRSFDVGGTTYLATREDGEWKMCGTR